MSTRTDAVETAAELMKAFAERTGAVPAGVARRYLWTDAFAVCNFLGLARVTGDARQLDRALHLVHDVHQVLGRRRPDDARRPVWLSGLGEEEGAAHPTRGGLRIGKPLPERRPDEPLDERLEWERDGQYFHYLTKWMHALDQVARALRDPRFNLWARELAAAAHVAFVRGAREPGHRRMAWKMSSDLSRSLVPSMGQHDPLDGYVTCTQLEHTAALLGAADDPDLAPARRDFAALTAATEIRTVDALGLGGLLADAFRLAQLPPRGDRRDGALLARVLVAAREGLAVYVRLGEWLGRPPRRLAFRELGLAIGLAAIELLHERARSRRVRGLDDESRDELDRLRAHGTLRHEIVSCWLAPENRRSAAWAEHRDINEVMLATSLLPSGFLELDGRV